MLILFYSLLFFICCFALYFSGGWVVKGLMRTSKFLGLREFVVAFFVMATAASLPNLFVGIASILHNVPSLALGDVMGNGLVILTLAMALSVFCSKGGIPAKSQMVQTTSLFTLIASLLPLFLILDGKLSRIDGVLLISLFIVYLVWLFSKKERFSKIYKNENSLTLSEELKIVFKDSGKILLGIIVLILSTQGIVVAAKFFAMSLNLPIILIGVLITGFASALPEISFAIISAKKGENWMILGDLMGAVIVPSTLVLGIVALIKPIVIHNFAPLLIAIIFLSVASLFFFFFVRSDKKITNKEAILLLVLYGLFVFSQIFFF